MAAALNYICNEQDQIMNKLRWLALLMAIAIVGITGFQGYWLRDNYLREKQSLDIKTNAAFRQTILQTQASKIHIEQIKINVDSIPTTVRMRPAQRAAKPRRPYVITKDPPITVINLLQEKAREIEGTDSSRPNRVIITNTSLGRLLRDSLDKFKQTRVNGEIRDILIPDSFRTVSEVKGSVQRMLFRKHLDSIPPENIRSIDIGRRNTGHSEVVIRYKEDNKKSSIEKEDVIVRGPTPPGFGGMIRGPKDTARNAVYQFLYNVDSIYSKDSLKLYEVDSAFAARLKADKMNLKFSVAKLDSIQPGASPSNVVTVGFSSPVTFQLSLLNAPTYLVKKLQLPILFSILLVGITIASFIMLYRNLLKQHRLGQMKNDLISNITHELKTPIATVSVAIEALRNFNAMDNPERTKEYLNISQNELQRLELLVDKVLKLSMFENKQIALQKEPVNLQQLVSEVIASLKFQAEKQHATINLVTSGDRFTILADKLHITSVIYNLVDNALKYSKENPVIEISLISHAQHVEMRVSDNGIGIPTEYKNRVFDKFFRVPAGNKHTIKGYGLGLSYVDHIVKSHQGVIEVESELDKGSIFIVNLPYDEQHQVDFGTGRTITKERFKS